MAKRTSDRQMKALCVFVEENKTDILDLECIPEESRFATSVCQVRWSDNAFHSAKVLKISDNMDELDTAEDAFHAQLESHTQKNQKRPRKPNQKYSSHKASERAVACAAKERPKLPAEQLKEKANINNKRKKMSAAKLKGQQDLDNAVLSLFDSNEAKSTPVPVLEDTDHNVDNTVDDDAGSPAPHEEGTEKKEDVMNNNVTQNVAFHQMRNLVNPSTRAFVTALAAFVGVEHSGAETTNSPEYIEVLPVRDEAVKCELTKGTGVLITVASKQRLRQDFSEKRTKLLHALMEELFSKEVFEKTYVTARGIVHGSRGIRQPVLMSMLAFINRVIPKDKRYKEADMIRDINRHATALRLSGVVPSLEKQAWSKVSSIPLSPKNSTVSEETDVLLVSRGPRRTPIKIPRSPSASTSTPVKNNTPTKYRPRRVATAILTPVKKQAASSASTTLINFTPIKKQAASSASTTLINLTPVKKQAASSANTEAINLTPVKDEAGSSGSTTAINLTPVKDQAASSSRTTLSTLTPPQYLPPYHQPLQGPPQYQPPTHYQPQHVPPPPPHYQPHQYHPTQYQPPHAPPPQYQPSNTGDYYQTHNYYSAYPNYTSAYPQSAASYPSSQQQHEGFHTSQQYHTQDKSQNPDLTYEKL